MGIIKLCTLVECLGFHEWDLRTIEHSYNVLFKWDIKKLCITNKNYIKIGVYSWLDKKTIWQLQNLFCNQLKDTKRGGDGGFILSSLFNLTCSLYNKASGWLYNISQFWREFWEIITVETWERSLNRANKLPSTIGGVLRQTYM